MAETTSTSTHEPGRTFTDGEIFDPARLLWDVWIPTMDGYMESALADHETAPDSHAEPSADPDDATTKSAPRKPAPRKPAMPRPGLEDYALWHRINLALGNHEPAPRSATSSWGRLDMDQDWDALADQALGARPAAPANDVHGSWSEHAATEHLLHTHNGRTPERSSGNLVTRST